MKKLLIISLLGIILTSCGGCSTVAPVETTPESTLYVDTKPTPLPPTPDPKSATSIEEAINLIKLYTESNDYIRGALNLSYAEATEFFGDINIIPDTQVENGIVIQGTADTDRFMIDTRTCISNILEYSTNFDGLISDISTVTTIKDTDKYGADVLKPILIMEFKMSELTKVNWSNFESENLDELAYICNKYY